MKFSVDKASVRCAEEVFRTVAMAANCLQIYSESHPRYTAPIGRVQALVQEYFERNPAANHLTFFSDGKNVEFRKIPLTNIGASGERLMRLLESRGMGGVQLRCGVTVEELGGMVKALVGPSAAAKIEAANAPIGDASRAKLIAKAAAEQMRNGWQQGSASWGDDGGLDIPEFLVSENAAHSLLTSYRDLLSRLEEGVLSNLQILNDTVDQAISFVSANQRHNSAEAAQTYFDDFTFHHSVNVCLLSTSIASTIVKDAEKLRLISLAALLHDVGKSRVPPEILHKPGKLTTGEFEVMKKHPVFGAELLLGIDKLDPLCVNVAFSHHLLNECSRYPVTRRPFEPQWITKLISVVDIYEALTAVRPYKKGLSPQRAFEVMFAMPGLGGSLDILKFVYDRLGPYPVGALVELATGERGVVTAASGTDPHRPKVKLYTDSRREFLLTPLEIDLSSPRSIQPGEEARRIARTIVRQGPADNPWGDDLPPEPDQILGSPLSDDQTLMGREG